MRTISTLALAAALASVPFIAAPRLAAQQTQRSPTDLQVVGRSFEQPQSSAYPVQMPPDVKLEVLPVLGNVYLLAGAKSNIAAQVGTDGVMLVDTATADVMAATADSTSSSSADPEMLCR